jgi:WD40 repeat protein
MTLSGVHDSTIWSISLSSSGLRMISASADGTLAEWKCLSATERKTLYPQDNSKAVWYVQCLNS